MRLRAESARPLLHMELVRDIARPAIEKVSQLGPSPERDPFQLAVRVRQPEPQVVAIPPDRLDIAKPYVSRDEPRHRVPGAEGLQVQIKDSVPGDFCFREGYGGKKNPIPETIGVSVPEATIDACTPGEIGLAADQDPALVFMVSFAPERRASAPSVTLDVTLP